MKYAIALIEIPDPPAPTRRMTKAEAIDAYLEARTTIDKRLAAINATTDTRCAFDIPFATLASI